MKTVKFALWGLGIRGKNVVRILGYDIICIIEKNPQLWGTCFENIPVVSFEEYLEGYAVYPIIVTPLGYEEQIGALLLQKGVSHVFPYSQNCHFLDGFRENGAVEQSLKMGDEFKEILVYGGELLGILLYNHLTKKGYNCRIMLPCDDRRSFPPGTGLAPWNRERIKDARVILTVPPKGEDRREMEGLETECEEFFQSYPPMLRNFYYDPRLERFKGIHRGRRCFIVATGPSLRIGDLDKLHKKKEICFGVNGIFAAFDKTRWRPDYYMAGDRNAVSKWKKEIAGVRTGTVFLADDTDFLLHEDNDHIWRWHIFRNWVEGEMPEFSHDFARGTFTGWTITYDGPLQLAVYMGFEEICLLGVDCNYVKGSRNNYFDGQQGQDEMDHHEERMILAYRAAERYTRSHGIRIYNATRGGMLEEFERVDFDSLMRG